MRELPWIARGTALIFAIWYLFGIVIFEYAADVVIILTQARNSDGVIVLSWSVLRARVVAWECTLAAGMAIGMGLMMWETRGVRHVRTVRIAMCAAALTTLTASLAWRRSLVP